jgi:hypothetical protein
VCLRSEFTLILPFHTDLFGGPTLTLEFGAPSPRRFWEVVNLLGAGCLPLAGAAAADEWVTTERFDSLVKKAPFILLGAAVMM